MKMNSYTNIDEYTVNFPDDVQAILTQVRQTINEVVPDGGEKIGYGIPTITYRGKNLVHFAAYSGHIGFYPGSGAIEEFADKLTEYETAKGTIKFPLGKPIPYDLIRDITSYMVSSNS